MKKIVILGTLDTKGKQLSYLKERIEARRQRAVMMDISMKDVSSSGGDITPAEIIPSPGHP